MPRRGARSQAKRDPTHSEARVAAAHVEIFGSPPEGKQICFLHAVLAQLGLPRRKTAERSFERPGRGVSLRLEAGALWGGDELGWLLQPLPYGAMARAILLDLFTLAIQGQDEQELFVERSPSAYAKRLSGAARGGERGNLGQLRQQIASLAAVNMVLGVSYGPNPHTFSGRPVRHFEGWVAPTDGGPALWPRKVHLDPDLLASLRMHGVPLDRRAILALSGSALALDIYAYLAHRLCRLDRRLDLSWKLLKTQFGREYALLKDFRREFLRQLTKVLLVYPQANVEAIRGGLLFTPSHPPVPKGRIAIAMA